MIDWSKYGIDAPYGASSGQKKVFCPQCHDTRNDKRDRSLSIDLATGMFNCHYCGWSGCAAEKDTDRRPWKNFAPIRSRPRKEYRRPPARPESPLGEKALGWFAGRGIGAATLARMKVTEGREWMPQKQKDCNTVQFNYYLGGVLVNTKFRTGDKCFKLVSGAELIPYNIDAIRGKPECIVTEGEMDCLSFIECGRDDCISVPNGANANLGYLDAFIGEYFEDKRTIYIASDTDTKGVVLRDELLRRFGADRCRVLEYGEGCKDANEHLVRFGKESLLKCLEDAPETKVEGVFRVSDFEQSLDALFENGLQKGVTVGHANLDALISFETRRLCIVTGIPSSGKSEFIDEVAERLNLRYGWRFAYFSPENAPLAYHASKLIEKFTGKKFDRQHLSFGEYHEAKEHLEDNFFFISPSSDFKLQTVLDRAKSLVRMRGIKALVIDPYNRLENEQGSMSETLYVSRSLDMLTGFAQENDVLVILMAHPTKMPRAAGGAVQAPTLYDISGSANFYNKADFGLTVHRDYQNQLVEVHVQKVKFRHLGEKGTAYFKYNADNGRYVPYYEGERPVWDDENHLRRKMAEEADRESEIGFGSGQDDFAAEGDLPY